MRERGGCHVNAGITKYMSDDMRMGVVHMWKACDVQVMPIEGTAAMRKGAGTDDKERVRPAFPFS